MNVNEAKSVLLLYRPGSADAEDPQTAEALALAKSDPALSAWLESHCARQIAMRTKFQQIAPPPGLREQIVSEHNAHRRAGARRRSVTMAIAASLALVAVTILVIFQLPPRQPDSHSLAVYQDEMASLALKGYGMDVLTNDPAAIRVFLTRRQAPADFTLPSGLQQRAELVGCSVENWQETRVSLVCFRTGQPLPPGAQADVWLFVVDSSFVKNPPAPAGPLFAEVNRLMTATWTSGGKLYFLGMGGTKEELQRYLPDKISRSSGAQFTDL